MTQTPWIRYQKPKIDSKISLFCFPYSGGAASTYRTWGEKLPQQIEILPIQLPGRETRIGERPFSKMSELIPVLADALNPYLDKKYAFFGHSLGSLISFELARELRRRKKSLPACLFVSSFSAPHLANLELPIHTAPDSILIEKLKNYNGTPLEVLTNREIMELMLPTLRADFSLRETYLFTNEKPLNSAIFAYGGENDATVRLDSLMAWRGHTDGAFNFQLFAGDHFYLHRSFELLLKAILRDLNSLKINV